MSRRRWSNCVLVGACVASLGSCSDEPTESVASGAGPSSGEAGAPTKSEDCSDAYRHFTVGPTSALAIDAHSGIAVRVLDGPVPPEYGYNTWKIALLDAKTMAPATNARLTWQCAYMSVHGHGSNPKSIENLGNGEYRLHDMNMKMLGPWEVRFWVDATGAVPEYNPTSNLINGKACTPTTGAQEEANFEIKACVPRSSD